MARVLHQEILHRAQQNCSPPCALLALVCLYFWISCLLFLHGGLLKHVHPALTGTALVLIAFGFVTATIYFMVKDAIDEDEAPNVAPPNDADAADDAAPDDDQAIVAPPTVRGSLSANLRRSTASPEGEMTATFSARRSTVSVQDNPLHAPGAASSLRAAANAVVAANRVAGGARVLTQDVDHERGRVSLRAAANAVLAASRFSDRGRASTAEV